jgi:hypothetical protein
MLLQMNQPSNMIFNCSQMIDENQKNLLINNAKSLGNSLGTANKKTLNISNKGNPGFVMVGIERE